MFALLHNGIGMKELVLLTELRMSTFLDSKLLVIGMAVHQPPIQFGERSPIGRQ